MTNQRHPIARTGDPIASVFMIRACLVALLLTMSGILVQGQVPAYAWTRTLDILLQAQSPTGNDTQGMRMDAVGNAYIFSSYSGTPDMDPGAG
jgi:hypothetical protein